MPSRTANEISSSTTATAAEPSGSCSIRWKRWTEATSVLNGRLPVIRTIAPISPMRARERHRDPGQDPGQDRRQDDATEGRELARPERLRGVLELLSSSISTGCTVRTTNGSVTNSSAT